MKVLKQMQHLSTGISLVILSVGFSLLGIVSFLNRHFETEAASRCLDNGVCVAGSVVSLLTGTAFLVAACLYWNRYSRLPAPRAIEGHVLSLHLRRPSAVQIRLAGHRGDEQNGVKLSPPITGSIPPISGSAGCPLSLLPCRACSQGHQELQQICAARR